MSISELSQGKRIRLLRKMCAMTREAFSQKYQIKEPTLRSWELDLTVISDRLAQILTDNLKKEGLFCTDTWIQYGKGPAPFFLQSGARLEEHDFETEPLKKEINMFLRSHKDAVIHFVNEEYHEPLYRIGDIVGGIKVFDPELIKRYEGQYCLVKDFQKSEALSLKYLGPSSKENCFSLSFLNAWKETASCKIIYDIALDFCAPIIWHRRVI